MKMMPLHLAIAEHFEEQTSDFAHVPMTIVRLLGQQWMREMISVTIGL